MKKYAAIDIGTVTSRMYVAECDGNQIVELARESVITNLGEDVDATGVLKPQAMERVYAAVRGFMEIINSFQEEGEEPICLTAMATSASRDAANSQEFAAGLEKLGVKLSVIPGSKEAALSFLGAARDFVGQPILVSDIGGGSTEIIAGIAGEEPLFAHSFNIGCRRVTERFFAHDPQTAEELDAARAWVREQFEPYFQSMRDQGFSPATVVSVAGTATSMVSIREEMQVYDRALVHGQRVTAAELDAIYERLTALPLEQRKQVVGLQPERACVINAGTLILQEVLRAARAEAFVASESDILQGIILTAVQE